MKLLIGAPVYRREWILPLWFQYIEGQNFPLSDVGFIFEAAPDDEETITCLTEWHEAHPEVWCFDVAVNQQEEHISHPEGRRTWTLDRYNAMARFRNNLLDRAICRNPDRYFSLDTDILLEDPNTVRALIDTTDDCSAAAPLMFMSNEMRHPSVMSWADGEQKRARRILKDYPLGETFKADAIMAAKMMGRRVYSEARYSWHPQGEDLGWSADCYLKGFDLYSVSGIYAPHIMSQGMLKNFLEHGDRRGNRMGRST